ncbi:5-formyltetrahydrofolate cyclo-ligase [Bacillus sp. ISL-35]|uniref:5-formyltetrahydrofolate cyclo-ligase n=1 Tax=Bacillus sp. ISL-35 TaxID=2819122 RepID=UPI001BE9D6D5|nr:5-formyltetrahydrofolate cyclo-ligase [Bacillus sp. ISL-35]MBT2677501.1 5-formyltetrahydrofolate cyclo-ligase [Bacillus sp. ISL-35]MBT2702111.1 5-formyltetrahydrofolate cyclo-ligase [Chryseobacterium sp. ISL-80]
MDAKKILRKSIKEKLSELNLPEYEDQSYQIAQQLYRSDEWISATTIAITVSKAPEVDTFQIIRKGWEQGKRIVVPKCEPKSRGLDFRELKRFSQLETVFYGLLEPIVSETDSVGRGEIDLVVVPGLAFSHSGYRLGFGGGYYDRFLADFQGMTVSLAFKDQLVGEIPVESHDIPVQKIIHGEGVIHIGN